MLTGTIGVAAEMNKLLRLIVFKVGQQVHFTGFFHDFQAGYMAFSHLHSEIKKAEGLSKRKPLGYVKKFILYMTIIPITNSVTKSSEPIETRNNPACNI